MNIAEDGESCRRLVVSVPDLSGRRDVRRLSQHLSDVAGVDALIVDVLAKTVTILGDVDEADVRAAVAASGSA